MRKTWEIGSNWHTLLLSISVGTSAMFGISFSSARKGYWNLCISIACIDIELERWIPK